MHSPEMARVSCCSRCVVKTEEEEFILPNGRPEIGPHAKTEEETEWNTGWGYPDVRRPGGGGVAFHGEVAQVHVHDAQVQVHVHAHRCAPQDNKSYIQKI